jgi:hypothetical protein
VCVRRTAREVEACLMLLPPSGEHQLPPVLDLDLAELGTWGASEQN